MTPTDITSATARSFASLRMTTPVPASRVPRPASRLCYIALNCSNGCRHALQKQIDLHAVEPNSLFTSVSRDPQ